MDTTNQKRLMEWFARKWATIYQKEHNKNPSVAPLLLDNAQVGLEYFLRDGFARAGGEQAGYGDIAVGAFRNCLYSIGNYKTFIQKENSPEMVWKEFERLCKMQGIGVNKKLNEGVIKGLITLGKESLNNDYNPFGYITQKIQNSMTDAFLALRNIKGIADKVASFLLRDMVSILDFEAKVPHEHGIFIQPVDRWVKETAICLWEDLGGERTPDWVIALRIVNKCNEFHVSGVRFNQGAWKYGTSEVINVKELRSKLEALSFLSS